MFRTRFSRDCVADRKRVRVGGGPDEAQPRYPGHRVAVLSSTLPELPTLVAALRADVPVVL